MALPSYKQENIEVLSVSEISGFLKRCVEGNFSNIKVRGEISGFKQHTSGHLYFALKDQETVLDSVCWRGTALSIKLEEGLEIIASGRITTYPGRSKYQMVIYHAEASGEGTLLKLLMDRKDRFEKEGLFARKRPLPSFPKTIGIITSLTGAVIKDILHRIEDRYPCRVIIWPTAVQGVRASSEVAKALSRFPTLPKEDRPDLIIVARGGGSLEDLWAFNEEEVVRAAANCPIPLVSAIGHETDFTLIDFAADLRAPTPTGAAELVTPVLEQVQKNLKQLSYQLFNAISKTMESYRQKITHSARLALVCRYALEFSFQRFDDAHGRFMGAYKNLFLRHNQRLEFLRVRLKSPRFLIREKAGLLTNNNQRLITNIRSFLISRERLLESYTIKLSENSYEKILQKGFCLVDDGHHILSSVAECSHFKEKKLFLRFHDGTLPIKLV